MATYLFETEEHKSLRAQARKFAQAEVLPHALAWEEAGIFPRELYATMADAGLMGIGYPEELGGQGGDLSHVLVAAEEMVLAGKSVGTTVGLGSHGIALPPILSVGSQYLKDKVARELLDFFADRLKVHLKEAGVRHDLISAVFALGNEDDLLRLMARVEALAAFLATDDGANLLVAYRRAANIVRIEEKKDKRTFDGAPDVGRYRLPEEKALAKAIDHARALQPDCPVIAMTPRGTPLTQARVRELMSYLRPFCLGIAVRLERSRPGLDHLASCGIRGLSASATELAGDGAAEVLVSLAGNARVHGMRSLLVEVEDAAIFTTHGLVNAVGLCLHSWTAPGDAVILFTPVYHAFARVLLAKARRENMTLREIVQETVSSVERNCVETALELAKGNRTAAAEMLGVSRQSLYSKLSRYALDPKDPSGSP